MRQIVATGVVTVLLAISAVATLQHVHAYSDHDHADHHHGPAVHGHARIAIAHAFDELSHVAWIEACDAGAHAVSAEFTCVAPHQDPAPVPVAVKVFDVVPPSASWRTRLPDDVRAHSPPRITDAPLRAPPPILPA